jgi:hypothetical protein
VAPRGHPELADIFRAHGAQLCGLSTQQQRAVAAITSCRTAALGGHVRECDRGCGYTHISYNSCRDRHCPKCQGLERVRWQEARAADLLPVPYFHLVFTIPPDLHDIFIAHPRVAYGLLFGAVAQTLKEVAADERNLGAEIGLTAHLDADAAFPPAHPLHRARRRLPGRHPRSHHPTQRRIPHPLQPAGRPLPQPHVDTPQR